MNLTLSVGFFISAFVSYIAYAVFVFTGRKRENSDLHFRNSYPFEYHMDMAMSYRVMAYVFLAIATIFQCGGFFFFGIFFHTFYGYSLAILCSLASVGICLSQAVSFRNYALHLVMALISFISLPSSMILMGIAGFLSDATDFQILFLKPVSVILIVLGTLGLIAMVNPKLMEWGKMNRTEEDGKTVYMKPKINFFALYEWALLLLSIVYSLILFLNLVFIIF